MAIGERGNMSKKRSSEGASFAEARDEAVAAVDNNMVLNASGYHDQLKRQYSIWGLAGLALTVDNAWVALGSSISVSILNGGPPGLIYGLIVAVFYYTFIGLGLAELTHLRFSSSVPTAGGVYHWAAIAAGPRRGRIVGFFTGWINFYGWMFDLAALTQVTANISVNMYWVYHQNTYVYQDWHVYVAYVLVLWTAAAVVIFANRAIPYTQNLGMIFVVLGGIVTIIVITAMPCAHASDHFVWASFHENNLTGWPSGLAFLLGVLNGAFTIGTPDAITHLAEELPHPKKDLPKAIGLQISLGFLYAFCFAIALAYAITDLSALQSGLNSYPLATIYGQATAHADGTPRPGAVLGLLFIIWCSSMLCCIGTVLTNSRTYWALARDGAVPYASFFARVDEARSCPVAATVFVCVLATGLGAIPLGSSTAFLDLTGSFIILSTVSYAIPFAANLATGRRNFPPGPFSLGRCGSAVNATAVVFIVFFDVLYCFPPAYPTAPESMNYNGVILVGVLVLSGAWWIVHARAKYPLPRAVQLYVNDNVGDSGTSMPPEGAVLMRPGDGYEQGQRREG